MKISENKIFNKEMECMDRDALKSLQDKRLVETVAHVYKNVPLYRQRMIDANVKPEEGCYTYNTRSSMVSLPKGKVAIINGLRDYIVVDTEDVLLICPRAEEQNIKKYIDEVKYNTGDKHI